MNIYIYLGVVTTISDFELKFLQAMKLLKLTARYLIFIPVVVEPSVIENDSTFIIELYQPVYSDNKYIFGPIMPVLERSFSSGNLIECSRQLCCRWRKR